MPGLLDNVVHIRPLAMGSLLAATLFAAAPELSSATLKAKLSSDAHLAADEGHEVFARSADTVQVGDATVAENMEFLTKTLSRFQNFAESAQQSILTRHQQEEQRLKDSISKASDENVKRALERSVVSNQEALHETQGIYSNIVSFSGDMLSMLKKTSKSGTTCDQLSCGKHASCADTFQGANCVCDEGYIGLGQECHAPADFAPHLLLGENAAQAADIQVASFDSNKVAVVFRDKSKGNAGALVVGTVGEAGALELSPLEVFTAPGTQAFAPVIAGTDGRQIAIAWRDDERKGNCRLRAAALGTSGIRVRHMQRSGLLNPAQWRCLSSLQEFQKRIPPNSDVSWATWNPRLSFHLPPRSIEGPPREFVAPEELETSEQRILLGSSDFIQKVYFAIQGEERVDGATNVAHKMVIQPFSMNRIMVLYSDKAKGSETSVESFGNSLLADIGSHGNISLLGNFRFTDSAVARLEATKVSKNGFVLAARASTAVDDMNPQASVKQEAMAMYGELVGEDLVFDPNPVNLEPEKGQIWARGLSLIAANTVAYAYQDASKLALALWTPLDEDGTEAGSFGH
eukprot:symbB.v1.2.025302.t2/scaffold2445.1/size151041/30